jgi:hypothetical protein
MNVKEEYKKKLVTLKEAAAVVSEAGGIGTIAASNAF